MHFALPGVACGGLCLRHRWELVLSKSLATWFNPRLGIKSRAKGASAVASSAYRACVSLHDERVGKTHDYTKKRGHVETFTVGPYSDISKLWNAAEKSETRKNSSVMRELIIPLPDEWDDKQRSKFCREFSEYLRDAYGVAVQASLHRPNAQSKNQHVHIVFTTRVVNDAGEFLAKTRILDEGMKNGEIKRLREKICEMMNRHAEEYGNDWYVYAGKFSEIEGMEDHVATKHIPRFAPAEVIDAIQEHNDTVIEYRRVKEESKQLELEREQLEKAIAAEEEKKKPYLDIGVPVAPGPFFPLAAPKVVAPAPIVPIAATPIIIPIESNQFPQRKPIPIKIQKAQRDMKDSQGKLEKIEEQLPKWRKHLDNLEENPPSKLARWSAKFGFGKEVIDEYDGKISKARENVQRLEDGRKHHHGVISNPELVAACKTFAEITQHNETVRKQEWERHVAKIAENHAANLEWIEKMRQFQNKPAPVDFIPVSPRTLPEMEHPYQLSGPEWEPPTRW